jgi:ribosomal protein L12E/L44/L45/RPP1/RPP2
MLVALIQLRQEAVDPTVPTDEIEDIDIEEMGFQATYTRLAVAAPPSVEMVPHKSVDEAIKNFVVKLAAADGAAGGALFGRIRNEVPPEARQVLAGWGISM